MALISESLKPIHIIFSILPSLLLFSFTFPVFVFNLVCQYFFASLYKFKERAITSLCYILSLCG
ncbi:hypothetical protein HMPREF1548_02405 [Clostridium sp. KLE 1755]|nr:hypothetical protein HMPREF1548_02405 [Clostridium sp. KLE 1755]